jgi:hypothetical protein
MFAKNAEQFTWFTAAAIKFKLFLLYIEYEHDLRNEMDTGKTEACQ